MPLVVPGITSGKGNDQQQSWMSKLAGKKIGDRHDETNFAKHDLPKEHRIVEPGNSMLTQDMNPNRMNIHVGDDGTVRNVDFK